MKFAIKPSSFAAACLMMASFAAQAASTTVQSGNSVSAGGYTFSDLNGTGTLSFSSTLIGALNAGGVDIQQVDPAVATITRNSRGKYTAVNIAAPVTSLTGDLSGSSFAATAVGTAGGALQTTVDDGFTTTGGSLSITNLTVDLTAKKVYATMIGGNGVGTINNLYLWDIASITGPTTATVSEGINTFSNTLSGLTINQPAFDLFAKSLGLTDAGKSALATVTDFGKITSTISVTAKANTPTVPEPGTYALMGLGLAAVGMVARRRAK